MMVSMETYLRQGQRRLERLGMEPGIRRGMTAVLCWGSGFLLSAASLLGYCLPLTMGLITALTGWQATAVTLGAIAGYPLFFQQGGLQGMVWAASAGVLAILTGDREQRREQPLMLPVITGILTAATGLAFRFILSQPTPLPVMLVQVGASLGSSVLFSQAAFRRDAVTDWITGGLAVFALAQVRLSSRMDLGSLGAGILCVSGAFPAAALAGLGMDLAQVTPLPMAAVTSLSWFLGLLPFRKRWQRHLSPGISAITVMVLCGIRDPTPLPGLVLGGMAGLLLPAKPQLYHRRGDTGPAQVRLELGAQVMTATRQILTRLEPPPPDPLVLLEKVRHRACSSCASRRGCVLREKLTPELLQNPLDADCARPGRLIPELHRARDQLRLLTAQRRQQGEYRDALMQQYRFLEGYLRTLSDSLPRRGEAPGAAFLIQASARSRGKEGVSGDRCLAFPGPGRRYYVLLCDGMGTGPGAARAAAAAGNHIQKLLRSGFPAEQALRSYNSLLTLGNQAGAVTVDLAELRLDTGQARLYKWGAAPSWVLTRKGAKKIGTATPPPGIAVTGIRESVEKLSLRRGEVLILLSDGVDGEEVLRHGDLTPEEPPGELAAKILEKGGGKEDDATAAVIRLHPTNPDPA